MEMKRQRFWMILVALNIAALYCPATLLLHADSDVAQLGAVLATIVIVFLLLIGDAVGVLMAYWE